MIRVSFVSGRLRGLPLLEGLDRDEREMNDEKVCV
jgi:hypothetical protein